jgi:hypothetical protein
MRGRRLNRGSKEGVDNGTTWAEQVDLYLNTTKRLYCREGYFVSRGQVDIVLCLHMCQMHLEKV